MSRKAEILRGCVEGRSCRPTACSGNRPGTEDSKRLGSWIWYKVRDRIESEVSLSDSNINYSRTASKRFECTETLPGLSFKGVYKQETGTTSRVASRRLDGQTFQAIRTPSLSSFCWMNSWKVAISKIQQDLINETDNNMWGLHSEKNYLIHIHLITE